MIKIVQCQTKKEYRLFENTAELIHASNKNFVPPFPTSVVKLVSPKSVTAKHGQLACWIAYKEGVPVGRIAAFTNGAYEKYHHEKTGFFGFFDFINEEEVARELINQATVFLKKQGCDKIRGPHNPDIEVGVLMNGFDEPPCVLMPYNPPYYSTVYEAVGLSKARDLSAYYIDAKEQTPDRVLKIIDRVKRNSGLKLRSVNLSKLKEELAIIKSLYNETLNRNWGFIPMTDEDIVATAEDLKPILDPNLVMIAEKDGVPAGFSLTIPDINEFLWNTKKNHSKIWRAIRFIWQLKTKTPKLARLAVLGVKPEYRNTGIGALFYAETLLRGQKKYQGGELSWIDEDNAEIVKGMTLMGAKKYKSYRVFEKNLN